MSGENKSTARRDALLAIQESVQKQWNDNDVHVISPGEGEGNAQEKYLCTFPYPYMNGVLHSGHAFTLAKAEFAARYHRLLGKQVLYPFAFHCTGMPIAACAKKIAREIELYGNPPVFPVEVEAPEEEKKEEKKEAVPGMKKRKGKGKLAKKKSKQKYQWQIMEEIGVPSSEIAAFADPEHWLHYFPPIAQDHLKSFGLYSDFRRSFITTDVNPYYDQFVRWQFESLRSAQKIAFGTRNTIFSPIDDQACADHDRAEGEGAGVSEYTLIKLKLLDQVETLDTILSTAAASEEVQAVLSANPEVKDALSSPKVILPAATLRPETMYVYVLCLTPFYMFISPNQLTQLAPLHISTYIYNLFAFP